MKSTEHYDNFKKGEWGKRRILPCNSSACCCNSCSLVNGRISVLSPGRDNEHSKSQLLQVLGVCLLLSYNTNYDSEKVDQGVVGLKKHFSLSLFVKSPLSKGHGKNTWQIQDCDSVMENSSIAKVSIKLNASPEEDDEIHLWHPVVRTKSVACCC